MTQIAEIPKEGWLLFCPGLGEYQLVGPNLESLAHIAECMVERRNAKFPEGGVPILCYELGRQMKFYLKSVIKSLEPT